MFSVFQYHFWITFLSSKFGLTRCIVFTIFRALLLCILYVVNVFSFHLSGPFVPICKFILLTGLKGWTGRIWSLNHSLPIPGSGGVCAEDHVEGETARADRVQMREQETSWRKKHRKTQAQWQLQECTERVSSVRLTLFFWLREKDNDLMTCSEWEQHSGRHSGSVKMFGCRRSQDLPLGIAICSTKGDIVGSSDRGRGQIGMTRYSRSNQAPLTATDKQIIDDSKLLQLLPSLLPKLANPLLWPSLSKG